MVSFKNLRIAILINFFLKCNYSDSLDITNNMTDNFGSIEVNNTIFGSGKRNLTFSGDLYNIEDSNISLINIEDIKNNATNFRGKSSTSKNILLNKMKKLSNITFVSNTGDVNETLLFKDSIISTPLCKAEPPPKFFIDPEENICYILLLSGGANRGAWQTGVLRGLLGKHMEFYNKTLRWDVVGGVSVGAILSLASLFYEPGDELNYITSLWDMWANVRQDFLSDCTLPIWKNIMKYLSHYVSTMINSKKKLRNSICNNYALKDYLSNRFGHLIPPYENKTYIEHKYYEHFKDSINNIESLKEFSNKTPDFLKNDFKIRRREVVVSAVRYEDGQFISWNSSSHSIQDLINATWASTSVPGAFSPVQINGSFYMDGGIVMNMNILDSIKACYNLGLAKKQSDIVIDAIETYPDDFEIQTEKSENSEFPSFKNIIYRSFAILHSQVRGIRLLKNVLCRFPDINVRYYIAPTVEEYEMFPNSAFDGNNITGVFNMLRTGLKTGWNANFSQIDNCSFNNKLFNSGTVTDIFIM
ncbi:patatin-like phospholipase family protein [Cryptosporidium muris RN66]|uniref:Patatin-like phospholipase family protein n=1 Tax=Cryptosporidium muris (strain RN66) TaxID=441375 RepID=B6AHF8_CRYMR|nr:patatin-like phospholipase family protein [Cryptosporidium muris RN66]EEA07653.1 patatin-like phospholipase family protein [Cryptosporidium muris RN66]|eukprot:XP_002142002.1 patatin-like phospholipase family protein [Cryptosporidium muris RN66]